MNATSLATRLYSFFTTEPAEELNRLFQTHASDDEPPKEFMMKECTKLAEHLLEGPKPPSVAKQIYDAIAIVKALPEFSRWGVHENDDQVALHALKMMRDGDDAFTIYFDKDVSGGQGQMFQTHHSRFQLQTD